MYSVILLAAGKGIRTGSSIPKQYLPLAGKPMIVHSLERFDMLDDISEVVVVCESEYIDKIQEYLRQYSIRKEVMFVEGGSTRQESVMNGLRTAKNEWVILHEAARPFVTKNEFQALMDCESENVTYTYSIPYTVLKKNACDEISGILNRDELVNIQLPQKFNRELLLDCHIKAAEERVQFTEDASLMYHYSEKKVACLKGSPYNIKITEHLDLLLGEVVYTEEILRRYT